MRWRIAAMAATVGAALFAAPAWAQDAPAAPAGALERDAQIETLLQRLNFALFREIGCPSQQQAYVLISETTEGWDLEVARSALQILAQSNHLCPAVSAVLATSVRAAQQAQAGAAAQPNATPVAGGDPVGGSGGPGYREQANRPR